MPYPVANQVSKNRGLKNKTNTGQTLANRGIPIVESQPAVSVLVVSIFEIQFLLVENRNRTTTPAEASNGFLGGFDWIGIDPKAIISSDKSCPCQVTRLAFGLTEFGRAELSHGGLRQ